jgi:hypothetical protein
MELDTGSPISAISDRLYNNKFSHVPLQKTGLVLQPVYFKHRPVPFSLVQKVENEIDRSEKWYFGACRNK